MNVDEAHDVIPLCEEQNSFPLEGVVNGHYKRDENTKINIINQLKKGVPLLVTQKV